MVMKPYKVYLSGRDLVGLILEALDMSELRELREIAGNIYGSEDNRKWLFTHTRNEDEYKLIRLALKVLSTFHPVEWVGKSGERHAVEVE